MRAATYVRLSASRLGDEAPGLERQRRDVARLVRERGWTAVPFHDADTSAFREGVPRPGFEALRAAVEAGEISAVVVWKMDRAFRRIKEAVDFLDLCQQRGVVFVSQQEGIDTSSPWGGVLFALFASVAQMESQTRRDRLLSWAGERARAGKPTGGGSRPFGFKQDGIRHEPTEARLIRAAARKLLNGGSLLAVTRDWNRTGSTPLGKPWTKTSVRRVMFSPRIAGLRQHRDETFQAIWKPIISQADHLALRARYSPGTRNASGRRYLLTGGLARCGVCGEALIARPKADGRRCYVCAADGCGKIRVLAAPLEEIVAHRVNDWREHHDTDEKPAAVKDLDAARRSLDADERALEELARERFVTRSITEPEFRAARDALVARITQTQEILSKQARPRLAKTWQDLYGSHTPPWEAEPGTDPDPDEFEAWRTWIAEVVEAVTVKPALRGRNRFDPDRVLIEWRERPRQDRRRRRRNARVQVPNRG